MPYSGKVVGDDVPGFNVGVADVGSPHEFVAWAAVGADGSFDLEVFEGASFVLTARRTLDGRYGRMAPVRPGAQVTLALEAGLEIRGTLPSDEGKPMQNVWVRASSPLWEATAGPDAEGAFQFDGLPPGRYDLQVFGTDATVPKVSVDAGTTGVRLRAGPP